MISKLKIFVTAAAGFFVMAACNNSGSDKATTDSATVTTETENANTTTNTETGDVQAPEKVKTSFQSKYASASNVRWSKYQNDVPIEWDWVGWPRLSESDYAVRFTMNGSDYWAWYDASGNWIGTVSTAGGSSLPAAVNKTLQSQYGKYTVTSVQKENDKDRTAYEIQMENGSDKLKLLVDENGKIMKKKGNVAGQDIKEKPVRIGI
mgnify:FL=1